MATRRMVNGVVPAARGARPTCNDCMAPLVWAVTEQGQRIPVNANQDFTGNLVLCYEVDALERPVSAQLVVIAPEGYQGPLWLSHFATCPKASEYAREQWRRCRGTRGEP